jgi:hypothetical protein
MTFVSDTRSCERSRAARITVVASDLATKHSTGHGVRSSAVVGRCQDEFS